MADVHIYVDRSAEKADTKMEDLAQVLGRLEHVSDVRVNPSGNVVVVSFEGGKDEQEEIERAVQQAGYGISRLSTRSDFPKEGKLWDI